MTGNEVEEVEGIGAIATASMETRRMDNTIVKNSHISTRIHHDTAITIRHSLHLPMGLQHHR